MTKALSFTEQGIRRAIRAAKHEGLSVTATTVHPDGAVTIHHEGVAGPVALEHIVGTSPSEWEDIEA